MYAVSKSVVFVLKDAYIFVPSKIQTKGPNEQKYRSARTQMSEYSDMRMYERTKMETNEDTNG